MKPPILNRLTIVALLLVLGICLAAGVTPRSKGKKTRKKTDQRVYLLHSDMLHYNQWGQNAGAQVLNGHVSFRHKGARLTCDSAYFYEESNSFKAFGHVKMTQGDTLQLNSDYAFYDGQEEMMEARRNVVLRHRQTKLYTDSLNFDRLYGRGYFFEGGKMVDKGNTLVSDWGEYDTETRQAQFNYDVDLKNNRFLMHSDTLYYDTKTSLAHVTGPSRITSGKSVIHTQDGWWNTNLKQGHLLDRSTVENQGRQITADSLFNDDAKGISRGWGNVVYRDIPHKQIMLADYFTYNDKQGTAMATDKALLKDFSQGDTLHLHGDTIRMYSYNMATDSLYRTMHCYPHVRAFRTDIQAVADSLVYCTRDSVMTLYKDPIVWNGQRQLLGERMEVFMRDSTVDHAHVIGQALSVEMLPDSVHYNQIASKEMFAFFENGVMEHTEAIGNVETVFYPTEKKDSTLMGLVSAQTDTLRMYLKDRQLQSVKSTKIQGTMYPITQVPPTKYKLPQFQWFDYIRPKDKDDLFLYRSKREGTKLRPVERHAAPVQHLDEEE